MDSSTNPSSPGSAVGTITSFTAPASADGTRKSAAWIVCGPSCFTAHGDFTERMMPDHLVRALTDKMTEQGISWVQVGDERDDLTEAQKREGWRATRTALDPSTLKNPDGSWKSDPMVDSVRSSWNKVKAMGAEHLFVSLCAHGGTRETPVGEGTEYPDVSDDDDKSVDSQATTESDESMSDGEGSGADQAPDKPKTRTDHYAHLASPGHRRYNYPINELYSVLSDHEGDLTVLINSCDANFGVWAAKALTKSCEGRGAHCTVILASGEHGSVTEEDARKVIKDLGASEIDVDMSDAVTLAQHLISAHTEDRDDLEKPNIVYKGTKYNLGREYYREKFEEVWPAVGK